MATSPCGSALTWTSWPPGVVGARAQLLERDRIRAADRYAAYREMRSPAEGATWSTPPSRRLRSVISSSCTGTSPGGGGPTRGWWTISGRRAPRNRPRRSRLDVEPRVGAALPGGARRAASLERAQVAGGHYEICVRGGVDWSGVEDGPAPSVGAGAASTLGAWPDAYGHSASAGARAPCPSTAARVLRAAPVTTAAAGGPVRRGLFGGPMDKLRYLGRSAPAHPGRVVPGPAPSRLRFLYYGLASASARARKR